MDCPSLSLRYRVDLFDMHQQQIKPANETNASDKPDVFSNFICQALPNAPSTCSRLHQDQEKSIISRAQKTSTGSPLETGELSQMQINRLKQKAAEWFPQLNHKNTDKPRTYENVSEKDFIGTGWKGLGENFKSRVDARAKRLQESGETDGHRWVCLSEESAKKPRNASWNMLRHLEALVRIREEATKGKDDSYIFSAPDIARPKYPLLLSPNKHHHAPLDKQGDWWGRIKRDHDDLFDKTMAKGIYCELDWERLFADDDFVLHVFYGKRN